MGTLLCRGIGLEALRVALRDLVPVLANPREVRACTRPGSRLRRGLFRQPQPPRPPPRPTRPVPAQRPRPWSLATPEHARCHRRRRSPAARRAAAVPSQLRTSAARCWAPCDVPRPFRLYFRQILARGHPTGATRPLRRQRRPNRPKSGGGTSCPPLTQ
jgi:hypothetical protein